MTARTRLLAPIAVVLTATAVALPLAADAAPAPWIVDAGRAKALLSKPNTLLLDARPPRQFAKSHLQRAINVVWRRLTRRQPPSERGVLLPPTVLGKRLAALGISRTHRLLVVGDARHGWGEDGWVVWLLRATGHSRSSLVDGGHQALRGAGFPIGNNDRPPVPAARKRRAVLSTTLTATADAVRRHLGDKGVVLLDSREAREFRGATPYGETRGGHVPGALNLHYRTLLDSRGLLLPRSKLLSKLSKLGLRRSKRVIVYCTGGVRSGWLTVVLAHLGYPRVQNYPGSMWQWAARDKKHIRSCGESARQAE